MKYWCDQNAYEMSNILMITGNLLFNEKPFICDCGRKYGYKKSFLLHKRHECGKPPSYACPHCPFKTKRKASLQLHVRCVHKDMSFTI